MKRNWDHPAVSGMAARATITMALSTVTLVGAAVAASPAWAEVSSSPIYSQLGQAQNLIPPPTGSPSADEQMTTTPIVYSDLYFELLAAAPSGIIEHCAAYEIIYGPGGVCDASVVYLYFYPDGTLGSRPWFEDPTSPAGWSVGPDPCDGLSEQEYLTWSAYVDFTNGWLAEGPELTDVQIVAYSACWGWWF